MKISTLSSPPFSVSRLLRVIHEMRGVIKNFPFVLKRRSRDEFRIITSASFKFLLFDFIRCQNGGFFSCHADWKCTFTERGLDSEIFFYRSLRNMQEEKNNGIIIGIYRKFNM